MPVTLKDIAMLSGISRQAVAAALEGDGSSRVSQETRQKVLALAKELNYIPNAAARKLRGGESRTIGVLVALGMTHPNAVFVEACHILRSRGYNCLIMDLFSGELPVLCQQLASCGVAGILVMDMETTPSKLLPMPELPIVFCRTKYGDADVDKENTGYIATKHLLEHGHKKVDYLTVAKIMSSRRQQGWARALKEYGATGKVIEVRSMDGSADALEEALKKEQVRALFCSNDFLAAKAIRILRDRNWKIPEDIAIVGCDGRSFVEFTTPSITTVVQPVRELAKQCAEMILERIAGKVNGIILERREVPVRLYIGGSCGCPEHKLERFYRLNTTGNLEKDYRLNFNTDLWHDEMNETIKTKGEK